MWILLAVLIGLVAGTALGWFLHQARSNDLAKQRAALAAPPATTAELQTSLHPLHEAVGQLAGAVRGMEEERTAAFSTLAAQVQSMTRTSSLLSHRTEQLVTSLRSPMVRGRWGEMQLERVVELGGMQRHVDFNTQVIASLGGKTVKPDLVVRLSGGRQIIVDAKVPYGAYLEALETEDPEENQAYLRQHARQLRSHVLQLSARDYISAFAPTPEFVVLFVPADPFLDAALSADPELLEFAFSRNIVIATPTTLFALLRTVAMSWRQEDFSTKAKEVHRLGNELYTRLGTLAEHFNRLGSSLDKTVEFFNATVGSVNSRVLVTARKLADLDIPTRTDKPPQEIHTIANRPRFMADISELEEET
ncbi:DNA recombination protein RmuC [Corynebacterium caspium]|uniref:DNA recombination protein RmuC n=1 Tax=Corynebacterium caspium TaxID=234828 RepID=UPI00037C08FB|nr:DNA recombination protein RmuC [Corynebacterium caspium]WKD59541.1 DNA recombination protein RmuC [Corynebacterium caspium DSM 44850]